MTCVHFVTTITMNIEPLTLREANDFVEPFHRHSKITARDGGKWAIGLAHDGEMVGVAIVGNPLAASFMDGYTAEVLRCCVNDNAPTNSCSMLYGRCWQIWRKMGGKKLITYTLAKESGSSLKGAGWKVVGETKPHKGWGSKTKQDGIKREWQPVYGQLKFRWEVE
jgi:hypothetical protein